RLHVTTEDIQTVAYPVLRHRLVTTFNADAEGVTTDDVVKKLLAAVALPQEEAAAKVRRAGGMDPAACPPRGPTLRRELLPPVCPECLRGTMFSRPCWRCKRTFLPKDDAGITCESCEPYLSGYAVSRWMREALNL